MSVIPCSRNNCENIMVPYQTKLGNICEECLDEFKQKCDPTNTILVHFLSFENQFKGFLESEKNYGPFVTINEEVDEFIKSISY
jgi:RecJ-like exonuclease